MVRISQETIDRIRDSSDILEVVSEYVELKRRGRNFFGLCPFHPEKTPSFSVAPDKQIYHCFGCGSGGNAITFLMEYEKIEFFEAVKKLGQRIGIEIEVQQDSGSKQFFTHLYEIHQLAVEHFQNNLKYSDGEKVLKYLEERGLSSDSLNQFSIGYAKDSWDDFYPIVKSKKIPDEVITKCGLFAKSEKGTFDRFRGRIMFPITNIAGKVVAFGGRDFTGNSNAKYLNSPETPIYYKSDILFGLSITKEAIRKEKSLIVLEGYMDFLQLYQNGIKNIVATSGTALTKNHVNQIRKFADSVYLAYDGDEAGRRAAIRAGYNLLNGGITPTIIQIPDGLDPDSWVKKSGPESFLNAAKNSSELIPFHIENCGFDLTNPSKRSQLAKEMMEEVGNIKDEIIRRFTIKQIADELNIDENPLVRILASKIKRQRLRERNSEPEQKTALFESTAEKAQLEIVKLIASREQEIVTFVKQHINLNNFSHPILKSLVDNLLSQYEKNGSFDLSGALGRFEKKTDRDIVSGILFDPPTHPDSRKVAIDCLITLEQNPIKQIISEQRLKLKELEKNGKDTTSAIVKVVELQQQLEELDNKRMELLSNS